MCKAEAHVARLEYVGIRARVSHIVNTDMLGVAHPVPERSFILAVVHVPVEYVGQALHRVAWSPILLARLSPSDPLFTCELDRHQCLVRLHANALGVELVLQVGVQHLTAVVIIVGWVRWRGSMAITRA